MALRELTSTCLQWSGMQLQEPMWMASKAVIHSLYTKIKPGEFGNWNNETVEKASRAFQVAIATLSAPITVPLCWAGNALQSIGDRIALEPYIKLESKATLKASEQETFLTFNACMLPGGLPMIFGGVRPASERMDRMASFLLEKDADVAILEEVPFSAGMSLWGKIKHQYHHGFTRIGPVSGQPLDSGLFIASKLPIVKEPVFIPLPSGGIMTRGVFYFETPVHAVFVTHLEPGDEPQDAAMRKKQLDGIMEAMKQVTHKPVMLLGDLNIKREGNDQDEYHTSGLSEHFANFFNPKINKESATCTSELTAYVKGKEVSGSTWEHIDYALIKKESSKKDYLDVSLVPAYDLKKPSEALSDHHGVFVKSFFPKRD